MVSLSTEWKEKKELKQTAAGYMIGLDTSSSYTSGAIIASSAPAAKTL